MAAKKPKTKFRLVCFDLDGTLIADTANIWRFICNEFGCDVKKKDEAAEKYFKNIITYNEWVGHDVEMWKKKEITKNDFLKAMGKLKLTKGAVETIKELRKRGMKVGIISDSLDIALVALLPDHEKLFDEVFINKMLFDNDGRISGWKATEYCMDRKADGLKRMAEKENIRLGECVFVGDEHNDVKAAEIAGLSIAFNPNSDELRRKADVVVEKKDLREILKHII